WLVIDRGGKVLIDRAGDAIAFAVSPQGKLGVLVFGQLAEAVPATGTVTPIPVDANEARIMAALAYQGDRLLIFGAHDVFTWNGTRVWRGTSFDTTIYMGYP